MSPAPRPSTTRTDTSRRSSPWSRLVGPLSPGQSLGVLGAAATCARSIATRTTRRCGRLRGGLIGAIAFDLVGGLVAFQLPAAREQYATKPVAARLTFALAHLQPFALPLTGEGTWTRATLRYGTAVASTLVLEYGFPHSARRRPIANAIAAALSLADLASDTSKQRWFGPVFTMKVVGGHGGIPATANPNR